MMSIKIVDIDDTIPPPLLLLLETTRRLSKIDPKTGAKVELKEKTMRANELKEAVGDFADPYTI